MRNHYVPQYYLRGFSTKKNRIWAYEKGTGRAFLVHVRKIASEVGLYSDQVERDLAYHVEEPTKPVLRKIRRSTPLSPPDKFVLARYLTALLNRVPAGLDRLNSLVPEVAEELRDRLHGDVDNLALHDRLREEERREFKVEIDAVLEDLTAGSRSDIWQDTILPDQTPRITAVLAAMTWRFFVCTSPDAFLTCDNPVHFFEGLGLQHPQAEVIVPISNKIALWASHRSGSDLGHVAVGSEIVDEFNRRIAANSTRHVFHSHREQWVIDLLHQKHYPLHRIV